MLIATPDPPPSRWAALRSALDAITRVPTRRLSIRPEFLAWAMPRYLSHRVDTPPPAEWTNAHGDLHYANLFGPDLSILDWEGWGRAPAGYDAATLHCRSLTRPEEAARIRSELAALLDTPEGRIAELVVITELLHVAATEGAHPKLVNHLHHRAAHLLR